MSHLTALRNGITMAALLSAVLSTAAIADVRLIQQREDLLRLAYKRDATNPATPPCVHKALVGIPPEGEVTLSVVRAETSSVVRNTQCGPTGPGPAYLGTHAFLREQRVVEIWFSDSTPEGSGYEEIVVDLHLPPAAGDYSISRLNPYAEQLYSSSLVNYQQARRWRRNLSSATAGKAFALADVPLLRISLTQTGIYQVFGSDLQQAGIDLDSFSPGDIALLYGGGEVLPRELGTGGGHDLGEMEILIEDGEDGRFDASDSFLFYGESLNRWDRDPDTSEYRFLQHPYTNNNVYWISLGADSGARGSIESSLPDAPASTVDTHRMRVHEEGETATTYKAAGNIQSGLEWYWEDFRGGDNDSFGLFISEPVAGSITIRLRFVARTESGRRFEVNWNNQPIGSAFFETEESHLFEYTANNGAQNGLNELTLDNVIGDLSLFDWYELELDRRLEAERGELLFDTADADGVVEYRLSGFSERPRLFEVSDGLTEIVDARFDAEAGTVMFRHRTNAVQRYAALTPRRFKTPDRIEAVDGTDLRDADIVGAEYLIIAHTDFIDQAERLAAWRGADDRFGAAPSTAVVDVQDIYDSFSGGLFDPIAIRDFLAYTTTNWNPAPMFVLLFGDGSYDYKNNSGTSTGNWIPPFQDQDLTSDDWFVCVVGDDQLPDMAIRRLPVQTSFDAQTVVGKLIAYDADPEAGDWQSRVLLIADDTFNADDMTLIETMFANDSEEMAARFLPTNVNIDKLYLQEFPLEGRFKPRARDAFVDRFNAGSVLLVYIGHGNSRVFAHEHIFVLSEDLDAIANDRRLPFVYTAASQMAVFDDPLRDSIPEALLKRTGGGIIGMIGATRVGFHESNMRLARNFHRLMFRAGRENSPVGLGLMEAKAISDADIRKILRYNLFGDPMMRIAFPSLSVQLETATDTLRALGEVRIAGRVLDEQGNSLEDFSGQARVLVLDSTTQRVQPDRGDTVRYQKPGSPIFRGLVPVVGGRFETTFRVPKDITYGAKQGRISAYAWDGQLSAYGSAGPFPLGSTDESAPVDTQGPEIDFSFDGRSVSNGRQALQVAPSALLQVRLRDPGGINVTGEIGHRIELHIDGEVTDVTERYEAGSDYREGAFEVLMPGLEQGLHRLQVEAWDTYNNWAEARLDFRVSDVDGLSKLLFHPNPLNEEDGYFTFSLSQATETVHIRVYSVAGKRIAEIEAAGTQGYNQIPWQPQPELANGTYLYEISAGNAPLRQGVIQVMR